MASSADTYTDASEASYLLLQPFDMPINGRAIWAIAFSSRSGTLITAALSVMLTVTFLCLWNLACFIALLSSSKTVKSRRRFAALVVIWNSNDPWFAFTKMLRYTFHYIRKREDGVFGLIWLLVSLAVFGGSIAMGIVGPSLVQIGSAAPVRPEITYHPAEAVPPDYSGVLKVYGLTAPSFLRALGSVEASDVTKRKKLKIKEVALQAWNGAEPMTQIDYEYTINGDEFGLQHGSDLSMAVKGSCVTEYGWGDDKEDAVDVYRLWGIENAMFPKISVDLGSLSIRNAPTAMFVPHPKFVEQYKTANMSFAIVPSSAHRASIVDSQTDPWYRTEPILDQLPDGVHFPYEATHWVKRNRPVLSCWQQDLWTYGSYPKGNLPSIVELARTQPDAVKVPVSLLEVLDLAAGMPMVVTMGTMSGDSALLSRTTSPNGVIDASASSAYKDMERLILASYVKTQNVLVDTTMFRSDGNWRNALLGDDNLPKPGAGDFIIVSPKIQTFSMAGLITITVLLGSLLLIEGVITTIIRWHQATSKDPSNNKLMRFKALSAIELFRRIYELDVDANDEKDDHWSCHAHWPSTEDDKEYYLRPCTIPGQSPWCKGHISKTKDDAPAAMTPPPAEKGTSSEPPPVYAGKGDGVQASAIPFTGTSSPTGSPAVSPGREVLEEEVNQRLLGGN